MDNKKVIGIYGVFAVGKSLLSHGVSSRLWDYDVVTTDNLLAIARSSDKTDPYLQQSSYLAWKVLGVDSRENIIEGFKRYRERLQPFIRIILDRAYEQRVNIVIEGIHISPRVFQEYEGLLDTKLCLITILDKGIHWDRVRKKCSDRPILLKRISPNFHYTRTLQEFLIGEAEKFNIPIIENCGSKKDTLEQIWRITNVR